MIFKKLKEMLTAFRDALRDTEETENIDWASTIGVVITVLITMILLVMLIEPLAMILKGKNLRMAGFQPHGTIRASA